MKITTIFTFNPPFSVLSPCFVSRQKLSTNDVTQLSFSLSYQFITTLDIRHKKTQGDNR